MIPKWQYELLIHVEKAGIVQPARGTFKGHLNSKTYDLFRKAGYLDQFGTLTKAGREAAREYEYNQPPRKRARKS